MGQLAAAPARQFGELRRNPLRGDWILRFPTGEGRKRAELIMGAAPESELEERRSIIGNIVKAARERGVLGDVHVQSALEALAKEDNRKRLPAWESAACTLIARATPPVPVAPKVPTLRQFAEQWASGELAKLHPQHIRPRKDYEKLRTGFAAMLSGAAGDTLIDSVTASTGKDAIDNLPDKLMRSTVRQYWSELHLLIKYAWFPCGWLKNNPFPEKLTPIAGKRRSSTFLRPEEDARLLACQTVPLEWRVWVGFMCRTGMSAYAEAGALRWSNIDLKTGAIQFTAKGGRPRWFVLDPGTLKGLQAWRRLRDCEETELVFTNERGQQWHGNEQHGTAARFRRHLLTSGVTRAELHHASALALPMRVEDCRATFITLSLAAGKPERWVRDRTGHTTSQTLERGHRNARCLQEMDLGELAPLYLAIPELHLASYAEASK